MTPGTTLGSGQCYQSYHCTTSALCHNHQNNQEAKQANACQGINSAVTLISHIFPACSSTSFSFCAWDEWVPGWSHLPGRGGEQPSFPWAEMCSGFGMSWLSDAGLIASRSFRQPQPQPVRGVHLPTHRHSHRLVQMDSRAWPAASWLGLELHTVQMRGRGRPEQRWPLRSHSLGQLNSRCRPIPQRNQEMLRDSSN